LVSLRSAPSNRVPVTTALMSCRAGQGNVVLV
jgi:hypothetical protein